MTSRVILRAEDKPRVDSGHVVEPARHRGLSRLILNEVVEPTVRPRS